jgi:hypothetical protein
MTNNNRIKFNTKLCCSSNADGSRPQVYFAIENKILKHMVFETDEPRIGILVENGNMIVYPNKKGRKLSTKGNTSNCATTFPASAFGITGSSRIPAQKIEGTLDTLTGKFYVPLPMDYPISRSKEPQHIPLPTHTRSSSSPTVKKSSVNNPGFVVSSINDMIARLKESYPNMVLDFKNDKIEATVKWV